MTLTLETSRLLLRPFAERDADAFSRYRSDPEVARYQGWDAPYPIEQARRFVAEMAALHPGIPGEWYQLALELKSGGEMIGDVAFQFLKEAPRQAEIGFTLAHPYQGQGYAGEAVRRLLAYLFDALGLHRVRANTDPANTASARLLRRAGMRHEGRFVDSLWFKGAWASEDWYAILRSEWQAGANL
jgi:RimJ/RimL family protein N-acetyltransferase